MGGGTLEKDIGDTTADGWEVDARRRKGGQSAKGLQKKKMVAGRKGAGGGKGKKRPGKCVRKRKIDMGGGGVNDVGATFQRNWRGGE